MTMRPTWLHFPAGPMFGWIHSPADGEASGGVVLCPPVGNEQVTAHRTFRLLAESLQAGGLVVLRFDYPGTGDSSGLTGSPGPWIDSVSAGVRYLRALGLERVGLVGMRMGATIAACVGQQELDVDALVLWDPCLSGRSFLREQRVLHALGSANLPPDLGEKQVEIPGFLYDAAAVAGLEALHLPAGAPVAGQTLVLARSTAERARLERRFADATVEWADASDQSALLDVSTVVSVVPWSTLRQVADWLTTALAGPRTPITMAAETDRAVVTSGGPGSEVFEQPVNIGPNRLFALRTWSPTGRTGLPTIVFFNVAREPHFGPGRLWVDLGRALAGAGFPVLRTDFRDIGDSPGASFAGSPDRGPWADEIPVSASYPPETLDDIAEIVAWVGGPVVLVGLCSGAYHAIEMGRALGVAGVCAINPGLDFVPAEVFAGRQMDARRLACHPRREWVQAATSRRAGAWLSRRIPGPAWRLIDVLHLQRAPATGLKLLADTSTETLILCGPHEAEAFLGRGGSTSRYLTQSEHFTFTVLPELDHALLQERQRAQVERLIRDHLLDRFVRPASAPSSGTVPSEGTSRRRARPRRVNAE